MGNIPNGPDDITWAWLSEVTGWSVDDVRVSHIGVGIGVSSAVYRVDLGGDECPPSVVVKLQALAPEAVEASVGLGLYRREVLFFRELAARSPIRVPTCHFTDIDETGGRFVIVMEDLDGNRIVDQVAGIGLTDAERAVERLGDWHATWWRDVDGFAERGLAVPLGSPIYPAVLPGLFREGWAKITAEAPAALAGLRDLEDRFADTLCALLAGLDRQPRTLLHGDYRADNMMFDPDGDVLLFDFQISGLGSAAFDLAYFVTQSLDTDVAAAGERALFDRWVDGLRSNGVPEQDLAGMWDDYRAAAMVCLIYPTVASRGMDLDDPRQRDLVDTMMQRSARAVDDLRLRDLLV